MSSGVTTDMSELEKELKRYGKRVDDIAELMPVLAEIYVAHVQERWDSAGNGTWPPLAESTLRKRRKAGLGAEILKNTGAAAGSVEADYGADYAGAATGVSYMRFHVSDEPRTVIPLRNPFDVEEAAWPDVQTTILDYLEGA